MQFSVEQLIVALLLLVPGFFLTAAEEVFQPRRFSTTYHRTVASLLWSLIINLIALLLYAWLSEAIQLGSSASQLKEAVHDQPATHWLAYLGGVYVFSILVGTLLGLFPQCRPRHIANRIGLARVSSHDSVWNAIFGKQRPSNKPITWLKVSRKNGPTFFGHLRHSTARVDLGRPIEIYLSPVFVENNGVLMPAEGAMGASAEGVYLWLEASTSVEFYFADAAWKPSVSVPPLKAAKPEDTQ